MPDKARSLPVFDFKLQFADNLRRAKWRLSLLKFSSATAGVSHIGPKTSVKEFNPTNDQLFPSRMNSHSQGTMILPTSENGAIAR